MPTPDRPPLVGIIMGSISDWETMEHASKQLNVFGIPHEVGIISAHRTPEWIQWYTRSALKRNLEIIIAGAGGAAHLPGMIAAETDLPVFGVPIESKALHGIDSLLSIVQMPAGIPVFTMAIGPAGATNAGVGAARILARHNPAIQLKLQEHRLGLVQKVIEANANVAGKLEGIAMPIPLDWLSDE